jgi:hypothetical protein
MGAMKGRGDKMSLLEIGDDVAVEDVIYGRQKFGWSELPLGLVLIFRSCSRQLIMIYLTTSLTQMPSCSSTLPLVLNLG